MGYPNGRLPDHALAAIPGGRLRPQRSCRECASLFDASPTGVSAYTCWSCRVMARVDSSGPCWRWTGAIKGNGYGHMAAPWPHRGAYVQAHRAVLHALGILSWDAQSVGGGRGDVDHLCRNRACVNPDQLEIVSRGENVRRGYAARKRDQQCV